MNRPTIALDVRTLRASLRILVALAIGIGGSSCQSASPFSDRNVVVGVDVFERRGRLGEMELVAENVFETDILDQLSTVLFGEATKWRRLSGEISAVWTHSFICYFDDGRTVRITTGGSRLVSGRWSAAIDQEIGDWLTSSATWHETSGAGAGR